MSSQRSSTPFKAVKANAVTRQTDSPSAQNDTMPPKEGIRPTNEGPWDPHRFQKYEISPEFRRQIMAVKPPAADPRIFQDTPPPIAPQEAHSMRGNDSESRNESRAVGVASRENRQLAPPASPRARMLAISVIVAALLGLWAGYRLFQPETPDAISNRTPGMTTPSPKSK